MSQLERQDPFQEALDEARTGLPWDRHAEEIVLGCALISSKIPPEMVGRVARRDFYYGPNQEIFDAIQWLFCQGEPVDEFSVAAWLEDRGLLERAGGRARLLEIRDKPTASADFRFYAERVRNDSLRRQALELRDELGGWARDKTLPPQELFERAALKLLELQGHRQDGPRTLAELARDEEARLESGEEVPALKFGTAPIDWLSGGLERGDVGLVVGRPGTGKTVWGVQQALHAAKSWGPAAYVSLEMKGTALARRCLAGHSGVAYRLLRQARRGPDGMSPREWAAVQDGLRHLQTLDHVWVEESAHTVSALVASLQRLRLEQKIEFAVIDYGQLVEDDSGGKRSMAEQVTAVARAMRFRVAKDLNIPLLVLVQASREADKAKEGTRLTMADIAWASQWEKDASQIWALNPDGEEDKEGGMRPVLADLIKNRNDSRGEVRLWLETKRFRFRARDEHQLEPPPARTYQTARLEDGW